MRLGKRERVVLQVKSAIAMAVKARNLRAGPFIRGIRSSCNITLPVGSPSRKWGWRWQAHLSALNTGRK